jgi:hypothetical protein
MLAATTRRHALLRLLLVRRLPSTSRSAAITAAARALTTLGSPGVRTRERPGSAFCDTTTTADTSRTMHTHIDRQEERWPPSPSLFPQPGPTHRGPGPAPPLPPHGEEEGADGPPRTPAPRKGDPLEDMDTVICHFEEGGGEQQHGRMSWEGSSWGGGIGSGHDHVNYGTKKSPAESGR